MNIEKIPEWALPTITRLINAGGIQKRNDQIECISEDAMKILVIIDRLGLI